MFYTTKNYRLLRSSTSITTTQPRKHTPLLHRNCNKPQIPANSNYTELEYKTTPLPPSLGDPPMNRTVLASSATKATAEVIDSTKTAVVHLVDITVRACVGIGGGTSTLRFNVAVAVSGGGIYATPTISAAA